MGRGFFLIAVLANSLAIATNFWYVGVVNWANLFMLFNLLCLVLMQRRVIFIMSDLLTVSGQAKKKGNKESFLREYLIETKALIDEVGHAISNINEIGQEKYSDLLNEIKNAGIRDSLQTANEKIITLRKKEKENIWVTEGVAAIAELKQKGNDLEEYGLHAISMIVKYLKANQGGFFLLKDEDGNNYFDLVASYAYGKRKFVEKRINAGEGLIGQVFYEKEIIYLTDVPKNYIRITSGLGEALPRCVCIVPLMSDGNLYGVIEVASFQKLQPHEIDYLKKIADSIGYNLGSMASNKRTEVLLQESQKMAQEVKAQEEELRQNMEELSATQEQMRRKEKELDAVMSSLSTVELDLEGKVIQANPIFLGITGYAQADIQGKLYKSLIPQHGNDPIQYEVMWSSILSGRSFSGEFRIVNKDQKEMWMAGNFTPILREDGRPYKIMVISLFTTQDKEKLIELQEVIAAIKNCFPIAEINQDMTFKSANDLFLSELGIKRLELKKTQLQNVLANGSFGKLEHFILSQHEQPDHVELNINKKDGSTKKFNTTLIKIGNNNGQNKKGMVILRNVL